MIQTRGPVVPAATATLHAAACQIPAGRVVTYAQLAMLVGIARGGRVAGAAMRHAPSTVPWHRVLGRASYGRARIAVMDARVAATQRARLRAEGVIVTANGSVDLREFGWLPLDSAT